jgi:hypothetical protein
MFSSADLHRQKWPIGQINKLKTLVEKPIRCAQLLCDDCPLRLGGDSGATARALLAVQNDVYKMGVMMQCQRNSPLPFGTAQFSSVQLGELFFIRFHLPSLMWTSGILRALWIVVQ